jgi:endonuclease/exonuclease/phosphatase family metal-dependent hydrolase
MRVISWNIQWGRGADGLVNFSRMVDTLRQLGPFDLICLQEVASRFPALPGGAEEDEAALLRAAFPDMQLVGAPGVDWPHPRGGRSRFGNMLLSRWPLGAVTRHRLPWPPEDGVPSMPRTALEAVVEHPEASLRIITTHLEYYALGQRLAQVDYLRQLQAEVVARSTHRLHPKSASGPFAAAPEPVAALVCGDFNFRPGSDEWASLGARTTQGVVWHDAWCALHGQQPHPHSVGLMGAEWPATPYCCDFFFVSTPVLGALRAITYDASSAASDHQPVVLELDPAALSPPPG